MKVRREWYRLSSTLHVTILQDGNIKNTYFERFTTLVADKTQKQKSMHCALHGSVLVSYVEYDEYF